MSKHLVPWKRSEWGYKNCCQKVKHRLGPIKAGLTCLLSLMPFILRVPPGSSQGWTPANTLYQQDKRRFYTWTSSDDQHRNQIDYILCSQRWRSCIQSAKTRLEADCGSDHELLIAKFRLKFKKVGKTTRPFRYDLNQIPFDYTV